MWNDTEIPLGYLITFRTYGTWLHGDERGSVDRFNNIYETAFMPKNKNWHRHNTKLLKGASVILNASQREAVEYAVRETCEKRNWELSAINVRTNHVHAVVLTGIIKPEKILNALKANATRQMRGNGCWALQYSPWADKGSNRYLWNEKSFEIAVDYVINGQGSELPKFD